MRKILGTLAIFLLAGALLLAEREAEDPGPGKLSREKPAPPAPARRASASLLDVKELKLTPEQRQKVEELDRQMRARMEEIRRWYNQETGKILTPKQKAILQQWRLRRLRGQDERRILYQLNLAAQQAGKIEAILQQKAEDLARMKDEQRELLEARQDLMQLQESDPDNAEAIRNKRQQIRTLTAPLVRLDRRYEQQISSVLDPEQRLKYERLKRELPRNRGGPGRTRSGPPRGE